MGWVAVGAWGPVAGWAALGIWGVVQIVLRVADGVFRIRYERARADAAVRILESMPSGISVHDHRSDGTMLAITPTSVSPAIAHVPEDSFARVDPNG